MRIHWLNVTPSYLWLFYCRFIYKYIRLRFLNLFFYYLLIFGNLLIFRNLLVFRNLLLSFFRYFFLNNFSFRLFWNWFFRICIVSNETLFFWRFNNFSFTAYNMDVIISHNDIFLAFSANICSWSTNFLMRIKFFKAYIQITILTIFWFIYTFKLMISMLIIWNTSLAILTRIIWMKFVVMLLNIININHLWTVRAFFNITSTIGKVAIDFGIRKLLFAILADLKIFHLFVNLNMKFIFLTDYIMNRY